MSKAGGRKAKERKLEAPPESEEMFKKDRPKDTASTRAKNTRHKQVTADKWNQ